MTIDFQTVKEQVNALAVIATDTGKPNLDDCLAKNEQGDAELFSWMFSDRFVFDYTQGDWYRYTGPYWEKVNPGELWHAVGNQVAAEYTLAAGRYRAAGGDDNRMRERDFLARAAALRSKKRVTAVLDWAKSLTPLPAHGWDRTQMLFTVENGVIDLATGKLRSGEPGDYLRAHAPAQWLGLDYRSPLWEKTIMQIFGGDAEMAAFIQRLLGYALTGLSNERILPIFYGAGANGKTTLKEVITAVLGADYFQETSAAALMESKHDDGKGPNPLIVSLQSKRMVWASESKEGQRLDMGLVKALTGGDTMSGRGMYAKEFVTFRPTHTPFLITNHLPHISADDQAAWDRVLAIEFSSRFVDNPQAANEYPRIANLKDRLNSETPGILAWLVRGCLDWQRQGLNPPAKVTATNAEYRESEDDFGLFCSEVFDTTDNPDTKIRAGDAYTRYCDWAIRYRMSPMSLTAFGRRMSAKYAKADDEKGKYYRFVVFKS